MSIRQSNPGGIVKPGFNPLSTQTTSYLYDIYSWGFNNNGQLGLNNRTYYSSPKQVGSGSYWVDVGAGGKNSHAVKNDGTLWSWGANDRGQLGLNNRTYYSSPKQVGSLTTWLKVSASRYMSVYAIKTDGTLWYWGNGANGQNGLGNLTSYSSPKQIGSLTNWASVNGGYGYAGAITTSGALYMWGANHTGQLGLNNTTNYSSPKQIGALSNWAKVSFNGEGVIALKTNGTMWSWGQNVSFGALGLNNTTNYSSPKQIGALSTWADVAGGQYYGIASSTSGYLWSWGKNGYGALGLNNRTNYSSPKQIGSLTNWARPAASDNGPYCIKTDGTLWAWGPNDQGQLGLGDTTSRSSPVQVGSLTNWYIIESNGTTPLALSF